MICDKCRAKNPKAFECIHFHSSPLLKRLREEGAVRGPSEQFVRAMSKAEDEHGSCTSVGGMAVDLGQPVPNVPSREDQTILAPMVGDDSSDTEIIEEAEKLLSHAFIERASKADTLLFHLLLAQLVRRLKAARKRINYLQEERDDYSYGTHRTQR